jgi:hypothetical protein
VNNGSEAIPAEWWNKTIEFEKKLGYRLVLKKISYPLKAPASKTIDYSMEWENKGVAPVYQQYQLIIRLTAGNKKYTMATAEDPRKWFPGTSVTSSSVKLPVNIPAGKYIVEVGLVKPGTLMAAVNLANEGKTDDGWYQAGEMEIIKK